MGQQAISSFQQALPPVSAEDLPDMAEQANDFWFQPEWQTAGMTCIPEQRPGAIPCGEDGSCLFCAALRDESRLFQQYRSRAGEIWNEMRDIRQDPESQWTSHPRDVKIFTQELIGALTQRGTFRKDVSHIGAIRCDYKTIISTVKEKKLTAYAVEGREITRNGVTKYAYRLWWDAGNKHYSQFAQCEFKEALGNISQRDKVGDHVECVLSLLWLAESNAQACAWLATVEELKLYHAKMEKWITEWTQPPIDVQGGPSLERPPSAHRHRHQRASQTRRRS